MENTLYYGDNLDILRTYIPDESVDLIYLDPPFNSKGSYNLLFKGERGYAPASEQAFTDSWRWSKGTAKTYDDEILGGNTPDNVRRTLQAFKQMLDTSPMMAYLTMMTPRLIELHRVLKPTGSLYLHCDPTASHYLRIILDTVFGPDRFRNEIIWKRSSGHSDAMRFGASHDTIFFYTKSQKIGTWNKQYLPRDDSALKTHDIARDPDGRIYRLGDASAAGQGPERRFGDRVLEPPPGTHWRFSQENIDKLLAEGRIVFTRNGTPRYKRYLDELPGMAVQDVWTDLQPINSGAREAEGYPTQKPLSLLKRIIQASTNPGDVVLDAFCGCGTAVDAAQELDRRWIGIDVAIRAIRIIEERLRGNHALIPGLDYRVTGRPQDEEGARKLATQGGYFFEDWALDLVRAEPWTGRAKRGSDRGRDGVIVFRDSETKAPHRALVQVKSGKDRKPMHVRDLRGTMDREGVEMGIFLTLEPPTNEMELEAATAGYYTDPVTKSKVPRLQILTIGDMLERGAHVELPEGSVIISRRIGRKAEVLPPAQRVLIPALPLSDPANVTRVAATVAKERRKKGQTA